MWQSDADLGSGKRYGDSCNSYKYSFFYRILASKNRPIELQETLHIFMRAVSTRENNVPIAMGATVRATNVLLGEI